MLVWIVVLAWMTSLHDSDAAGNGMTQGFSGVGIILLWILLAILALIAGIAGRVPTWLALTAVVAIPLTGYGAIVALEILSGSAHIPFLWPIVVPALVPPTIVLTSLWLIVKPYSRDRV
ncbi:MAG TPA: hypothetical protein VID77_12195 [Stellaceae bacterium]|jgi:hypothetical protein